MKSSSFALLASLSISVFAACGGSTPAPEAAPAAPSAMPSAEAPAAPSAAAPAPSAAPAPEASATPPAAAPAEPAWDDKTIEQKKDVMMKEVVPKMGALFKEFDAKRFADVRCPTCHGPGAKEGKFAMPNPALPKLDPKDGFAKHKKKDEKIVKFMMEHVVPEMAKILGEPPYDPAKNSGFGCFDCHTMQGK